MVRKITLAITLYGGNLDWREGKILSSNQGLGSPRQANWSLSGHCNLGPSGGIEKNTEAGSPQR